jgi:DhnA family fructose-bisphosphate aldolase class Ia
MTGRDIRLSRLFSQGRNAVVVAIDHGMFDGPIPGMVNLPEVVASINPDVSAVLLSFGMLPHCSHAFNYKGAPMVIVRTNWSSHFVFHWGYSEGISVKAVSVSQAVAAGADLVITCLPLKTGSEAVDASNVELFCHTVNEAHSLGIPVIGEVFPTKPGTVSPDEMQNIVMTGCRIAAELGADLIKTFYTKDFPAVVAGCPVPILCLGAEKMPKQIQALELAERVVQDGGRGVVFGRNAIQVPNPTAFQQALCAVVQNGISATEAVKRYGLVD